MDKFSEKNRIFLIRKDESIEEYLDLESIICPSEDIELIIIDKFRDLIDSTYKSWRRSKFTLYNAFKKEIKYSLNKWTIEDFDIIYIDTNRIKVNLIVSDYTNSIRTIKYEYKKPTASKNNIGLIPLGIKEFHKRSKYDNWKQYDLMIENETLKKEIEKLKEDIK